MQRPQRQREKQASCVWPMLNVLAVTAGGTRWCPMRKACTTGCCGRSGTRHTGCRNGCIAECVDLQPTLGWRPCQPPSRSRKSCPSRDRSQRMAGSTSTAPLRTRPQAPASLQDWLQQLSGLQCDGLRRLPTDAQLRTCFPAVNNCNPSHAPTHHQESSRGSIASVTLTD